MGSCLSSDGRNSNPNSPSLGYRKQRKNTKKKQVLVRNASSTSSSNSKWEDHLHRIPGRFFLSGSSDYASLFTQQGKKGINQDAMVVWENFGSRTDTVFCGVFDGHGPYGHMVAKRVRDSLPLRFSSQLERYDDGLKENNSPRESMNSDETASLSIDDEPWNSLDVEDKEMKLHRVSSLKESFLKAFKVMDRELKLYPSGDCYCSGTTAVTMVKQGLDLVIGNVGDSRAIIATRDQDDSLIAEQLTKDLKPDLPREAERIMQCGGRIFALQREPDVARVWLPNTDAPGLAMARAFGDFCLKKHGVISVPDVSYRRLTEKDEFVVLATDGVWDVLSNKEVVDIVNSAPTRASAARTLVESAVRSWRIEFPTSKIDDCAAVCLFLNPSASTISSTSSSMSRSKIQPEPMDQIDDGEYLSDSPAVLDKEEAKKHDSEKVVVLEDEWSALDGVTRLNTMVNLPRMDLKEQGK